MFTSIVYQYVMFSKWIILINVTTFESNHGPKSHRIFGIILGPFNLPMLTHLLIVKLNFIYTIEVSYMTLRCW